MVSIDELYPEKTLHSIRINDKLVEVAKNTGIPFSNIVETCLTNFSTLNDQQRINFLVNNDPSKVDESRIIQPEFNYADEAVKKAKESLGNKFNNRTSLKLLITMGLVLLLSLFMSKKENQ
jgi:predicted PurR-regulated permease PerM